MTKEKENKKSRKKINFRRTIIFLLFLYVLYAVISSLIKLPIKHIFITGNKLVSDNEIIIAAKIKNYPPIIKINKKNMIKNIIKNELIKSANITKKINGTLEITIIENKPLYINKNTDEVVLDNGKKVSFKNLIPLPILINYIPDNIYKDFINNYSKIDDSIIENINSIEYKPDYNEKGEVIDEKTFSLVMNDGNKIISNTNRLENLNYYFEMLTGIESKYQGKKGTIYLDSADPETFPFIVDGDNNAEK